MNKLKLLLSILLIFTSLLASAQSRRQMRSAEKKAQSEIKSGYDFTIPPIERVPEFKPVSVRTASLLAAQTNWGKDLLLPATLVARIKSECKYQVVVKVTDTAPKIAHDYLKIGQLPGSNYTGEAGTDDLNGHGTHCAGIIAAREIGLAYPLVELGLLKFKPIKILSNSGSGSFTWVEQAYKTELAEDVAFIKSGTSVIYSGSFGGGTQAIASVDAALKASTEQGVLFVFAAGNSGVEGVGYPALSQYSIAVASLDQSPLQRSSFSSTGPQVWIAEPGRSINSTYKGNTFAVLSGTSMATPFGAALLAIAKSKWGPDKLKTVEQARSYLQRISTDLKPDGKDNQTGYGIAYVLAVLDTDPGASDPNPPPPPPPPPPTPPTDPVFPERTLTLPIQGPFQFVWDIAGSGGSLTAYEFLPDGIRIIPESGPKKALTIGSVANIAAMKPFTCTSLVLEVKTKTDLTATFALTEENTRVFYQGRGFGLPAPADGVDALKWSAYFLEMFLREFVDKKQTIRVVQIEGIGPNKEKVILKEAQIPHWKS